MRKLKLAIEKLQVESFKTDETRAARGGTVAGHMARPTPTFQPTERVTGPCCDITLALSCVQTNCLTQCGILTADFCV
jgi:hypothetical protein